MRTLPLFTALAATLFLAGCDAAGPDDALVTGAATTASVTRTPVCHYDADAGSFARITVADPALDAHFAHGDGVPGGAVPNQAGYTFDDACVPQPDGPPGYACIRSPITNGLRVEAQSPAGATLVWLNYVNLGNTTANINLPAGYADVVLLDPGSPGSARVTFGFDDAGGPVPLLCPVTIPASTP